jgi:hypothetical protein
LLSDVLTTKKVPFSLILENEVEKLEGNLLEDVRLKNAIKIVQSDNSEKLLVSSTMQIFNFSQFEKRKTGPPILR